jgi:hypothetical protein
MPKLFMVLLGSRPPGRLTEQHDVFFGIGHSLKDLVPAIKNSWPEAKRNLHVDAWREVNVVDGFSITVTARATSEDKTQRLFFVNLGGYKKEEFDEFHYKMLVVASSKTDAIRLSKQTAFYKHNGFKGAASHIDDLYGVDADDVYEVEEILSPEFKEKWSIVTTPVESAAEDLVNLGYLQLFKIK